MTERPNRGSRVSPAAILASVALALALVQPAQAALKSLPGNSVGTKQLKKSAVTSPKIKNKTVRRADLAPSARPQLPRAFASSKDVWEPLEASQKAHLSLKLPAGRWAVTGNAHVTNVYTTASQWCYLVTSNGKTWDFADSFVNSAPGATNLRRRVGLQSVVDLKAPARLDISCSGVGNFGFAKLMAVEVR
jgi:hypothetical protein